MWIKPRARVAVTLTDGTTLEGAARFAWAFWRTVKLTEVTASGRMGDVDAAGVFYIPRHSILMIQAVV